MILDWNTIISRKQGNLWYLRYILACYLKLKICVEYGGAFECVWSEFEKPNMILTYNGYLVSENLILYAVISGFWHWKVF